jgi:6-phospho-beta-glucosidase
VSPANPPPGSSPPGSSRAGGLRIAVVGGGSQFSVGLCESLVDYARDALNGSTVVLLDTKADHVETVGRYARRLAAEVGVDMTFEWTLDRRRAFDGADILLTTFRPGSHDELEQDETIPVRHGLQGNETIGVGGMFMACRVAPVLAGMLADATELCPAATMVNYTNPTQYVADIAGRLSDLKVISLCDGYVDVMLALGDFFDCEPTSIQLRVAGTNHAMWVLDFTVGDRPGYPLLRARLDELGPAGVAKLLAPPARPVMFGMEFAYADLYKQFAGSSGLRFSLELYELFGLLPGPPYYWRYLLDQDAVIAEQRQPGYVTMAGFYKKFLLPGMFDGLDGRLTATAAALRWPRAAGVTGHGDLAVRVISAIAADSGEEFVVNVRNNGTVTNLPDDAVLELSATVDAAGAQPLPVGDLPGPIAGLQRDLVASQQLAVTAALSGDRDELLRAIVTHPLVSSLHAARDAMDELLAAQAAWLPQFAASTAGRRLWAARRSRRRSPPAAGHARARRMRSGPPGWTPAGWPSSRAASSGCSAGGPTR